MAQPVTLQGLADELEALGSLCPVLLPSVVPQGFDDQDLWGLVNTEGKEQQEEFKSVLKAAAKQLKQQQQTPVCAVCGVKGVPTCSAEERPDERQVLRFTTLPTVHFVEREIHLTTAGFACGSCRALRDAAQFLIFAASCTSTSATPKQHRERHSMAAELCLHLASVNRAPEQLQSNSELLTTWTQEIMSRSYALQILASNIEGWKLFGPGGVSVTQATPGLSVKLLKAMLTPRKKIKAVNAKMVAADTSSIKRKKAGQGLAVADNGDEDLGINRQQIPSRTDRVKQLGVKQHQNQTQQLSEANGQPLAKQAKKHARPAAAEEANGARPQKKSVKAAGKSQGHHVTIGDENGFTHQAGHHDVTVKVKKRRVHATKKT